MPDRTGLPGRRAEWCSKVCRQAAWRARAAAGRASRSAAELSDRIAGTGYGDVLAAGTALGEAVITMCEQSDGAHEDALMTGHRWERDVADAARRLAAAARTVAELADAHATQATEFRRARAVIRRPPASSAPGDDSPADRIVATTAAEASATKPPASETTSEAGAAVDVDDLFDAVEDVLDARDVPGIPQDVLAGEDDVLGTSFASALEELAAVHAAASGDGPHGELVAAAAVVVRARPPYLPARVETAVGRLAAVLPDSTGGAR